MTNAVSEHLPTCRGALAKPKEAEKRRYAMYYGTIVHSLSPTKLEIVTKTLLHVSADGRVSELRLNVVRETVDQIAKELGVDPKDVSIVN